MHWRSLDGGKLLELSRQHRTGEKLLHVKDEEGWQLQCLHASLMPTCEQGNV